MSTPILQQPQTPAAAGLRAPLIVAQVADVRVERDLDFVPGRDFLNVSHYMLVELFDVGLVKIDDDVERYPLALLVDIEPVHLDDIVVVHDEPGDLIADAHRLVVAGVPGIEAHCRKYDRGLFIDCLDDVSCQLVELLGGNGIVDFNVERAQEPVGAVVVENDVIDAVDTGHSTYYLLDLLGIFAFDPVAEHVVYRLADHLVACLEDEDRDEDADVSFGIEACREEYYRRDEDCRGQDGVEERVGPGSLEQFGFDLRGLLTEVQSEEYLDYDGHADDDERDHVVVGRFGRDYLLDGFDQSRDAGVEDQQCDRHLA